MLIPCQRKPVAIVCSGAYANSEICGEFGRLPPSFLPIGSERLYALQVRELRRIADRIVISLPADFVLDLWDQEELARLGVEIVRTNPAGSLGRSLAEVIVASAALDRIIILHGDTAFMGGLPESGDWVSVSASSRLYSWGRVDSAGNFADRPLDGAPGIGGQLDRVLTGAFMITSGFRLLQALFSADDNFLDALNLYSEKTPLQLIEVSQWLDFGHLQGFYQSKVAVVTARSFNSLVFDAVSVLKGGDNQGKICAEAAWFQALPPPLRIYVPAFLGEERVGGGGVAYRIGYEFNPTLHELSVFGALSPEAWRVIFVKCFAFFQDCRKYSVSSGLNSAIDSLAVDKTLDRLDRLRGDVILRVDKEWSYAGRKLPSPMAIAEQTGKFISGNHRVIPGVMHGDFCFPNLFYDFRKSSIKVIDPRGGVHGGVHSPYGDLLYDLAKLNHSIEGYDLILAGRYNISGFNDGDVTLSLSQGGAWGWFRELAQEFELDGVMLGSPLVTALTVQLFLSMLPLHADNPNRQRAFLANAMRLFASLDFSARSS